MSIDQLRRECNAVVKESNRRWENIPEDLKKEKKIIIQMPVNAIPVRVYDINNMLVAEYESMNQAARYAGVKDHYVRKSVEKNIFIDTKYGELRFER